MNPAFRKLAQEIRTYRLILGHARTPKVSKILIGLAIGYFLTPVDLLPDTIPLLGHLDDALVIPVILWAALKGVPKEVVQECRLQACLERKS